MGETRKERIFYKMSSEIANMMKVEFQDVDKIFQHMKGFSKQSIKSIEYNLNRFYLMVSKSAARQKQRRGIAYKIDLVLKENKNLNKESQDPEFVSIEK